MTHVRAFQILVAVSTVVFLAWFFLPYAPINRPLVTEKLLRLDGYGSVVPWVNHPLFYYPFLAGRLAAALGSFLFLSWGRWLWLAVVVIDLAILPFRGVMISSPPDTVVGALTGLLDGAVIAMAFLPPISGYWRKDV